MFGFQWSGNELQRTRVCEPKIYFFVKTLWLYVKFTKNIELQAI